MKCHDCKAERIQFLMKFIQNKHKILYTEQMEEPEMKEYLKIFYYDIMKFMDYLPACLLIACILEAATILILLILKKKIRFYKALYVMLFWTYITAVVFITLLSREPGSRGGMSFDLFSTWGSSKTSRAFVLENILLFIPFGFLLPLVFRPARHIRIMLLMAVLYSSAIEITQVYTGMGYGQIDDIITNVLGAGIGYDLWLLVFQDHYLRLIQHQD